MSDTLLCPFCNSRRYKTLGSGSITRCCGKKVVRVNGGIYAMKEDAPEWKVLQHFISCMRRRLPHYDIPYPSSSYREILPAVGILIEKSGDADLAKLVIDEAFKSWPKLDTIYGVISKRMFPTFLAKAKRSQSNERTRDEVERYAEDASTFRLAGEGQLALG